MKDFSVFKDYYLIKCFENENYRESFCGGTNLYMKNMSYFHDVDNPFQQDSEGLVFQQEKNSEAYLVESNVDVAEELYKIGVSNFKNNFWGDIDYQIENFLDLLCKDGQLSGKVKDTKICISGYISCFYIIHKKLVSFEKRNINFINEKEMNNFIFFLSDYSNSREKCEVAYVSVFDAETFLKNFFDKMENYGYKIACGSVKYNDLTEEEKVQAYNEGNISKIVFTKNKKYNYQREFRIYVVKDGEFSNEFIQEKGVNFHESLIENFVYLSEVYLNKRKEGVNNEI